MTSCSYNDKVESSDLKSFIRQDRHDEMIWYMAVDRVACIDWETLPPSLVWLRYDDAWQLATFNNLGAGGAWCHAVISTLASSNTSWPFSAKFFQLTCPGSLPFLYYLYLISLSWTMTWWLILRHQVRTSVSVSVYHQLHCPINTCSV